MVNTSLVRQEKDVLVETGGSSGRSKQLSSSSILKETRHGLNEKWLNKSQRPFEAVKYASVV